MITQLVFFKVRQALEEFLENQRVFSYEYDHMETKWDLHMHKALILLFWKFLGFKLGNGLNVIRKWRPYKDQSSFYVLGELEG